MCYRHKLTGLIYGPKARWVWSRRLKKTCKSAPAWASGPHGPCILRFSLRLEIESNWDKISLDCFPSLRTINMYPMLFMKRERHHVSQTTLGASPPLILGFHPSKCHAALIASCDQGSVVLALTFGITRTEAFLMASNTSYPNVRSMAFCRSIMPHCLSSTNITLFLCCHVSILC